MKEIEEIAANGHEETKTTNETENRVRTVVNEGRT